MAEKIVMKGTREVTHHLFKLKPAIMKRNVSWKWKQPSLVDIEHTHIYHSIEGDSLQPQKFSAPIGGHFHEVFVEYGRDEKGNETIVSAKCGPPLHHVYTKIPGDEIGGINEIKEIEFERHEVVERNDKGRRMKDGHTHEVEYIDSEVLSARISNQYRQDERAKLQNAMSGPGNSQAAKQAKMQDNAAKVASHVKES